MTASETRQLVMECQGRALALPAAMVGEVLADRPVHPLPLAPSAIAGITTDRGRPITVIELDRLLRLEGPPSPSSYLVVLAPPFAHLALRVRGELHIEPENARDMRPEVLLVEPLLQALEAALGRRSAPSR